MVSVIIPTYNREGPLQYAMQSVINQTYQFWELIIVDDGSTDNTRDAVEKFRNENIKYLFQKRKGVSAARNRGIMAANGNYLSFLDSDDSFLPHKLETQIESMESSPKYMMSYSNVLFVDNNKEVVIRDEQMHLSGNIYPQMLFMRDCFISTPAVIVKRKALDEVGGFDVNMKMCEDLDLWRRIARYFPVLHLPEPLVMVRYKTKDMINIKKSYGARKKYYEKAFSEDRSISKSLKKDLRYEMHSVYGIPIFSKGAILRNIKGLKKRLREGVLCGKK